MKIEIKNEFKTWGIYFAVALLAMFVHELGHCIPAWFHGYKVIPTPAKEYPLENIPQYLQLYISLGAILGSILFVLLIFYVYLTRTFKYNSAILAGAIANAGGYTLMFILKGRGHSDTEFQEAQAALGLNYSGHSLDWIFLILFVFGVVIWIMKAKPNYGVAGRLLVGFILTIIFLQASQDINNKFFDPIFQS